MGIKEATSSFLKVMKEWKYLTIAIIFAILFYILNIFLSNFRDLINIAKSDGFFSMLGVFPLFIINYADFFTYKFFIGLIIISLLFGSLVSLITYKTRMLKNFSKKTGFLTSAGIFFGVIAPGCSACGVGFISVIGFGSAAIAFLPWKGFELMILSVLLLLYAVYKISIQINTGIVCEIPISKKINSDKHL